MYGPATPGADTRVFKIDYSGMLNPVSSLSTSEKIRRSSCSTVVPYNRMSSEVQRILGLGGRITKISSLTLS